MNYLETYLVPFGESFHVDMLTAENMSFLVHRNIRKITVCSTYIAARLFPYCGILSKQQYHRLASSSTNLIRKQYHNNRFTI